MVGSLMYLTDSRPDIVFAFVMYYCARYHAKPTKKHFEVINVSFECGSMRDVKLHEEVRREVLQFLGVDWLVLVIKETTSTAISNTEGHVWMLCSNPLGCDPSSKTTEFDFIKFLYILTKAFAKWERFEFLLPRLGMKSLTPQTLKRLQEEEDE
ncbi:hypothetical protein Tco_1351748 [Tanacetum coccineum]